MHCAVCHGAELDGGLGGSLLTGEWKYIGEELSFIDYVAKGNEEMGMPAFSELLDRSEVRSLEIYIQEMQQKASRGSTPERAPDDFVFEAGTVRFTLETVVDDLKDPWALSFSRMDAASLPQKAESSIFSRWMAAPRRSSTCRQIFGCTDRVASWK